jgi:hypothetical protein
VFNCCVNGLQVILGDFCMQPADSIINVLDFSGNGSSLLSYYLKCEGKSKFAAPLVNATHAVRAFNLTVYQQVQSARNTYHNQSLGQACLDGFSATIDETLISLANITHSLQCQPIYNVFNMAVNESLCSNAFTGFFSVWLCHLLTAGFLYFVLMEVSFFHDMYKADQTPVAPSPVDAEAVATDDKAQFEMVTPMQAPQQIIYVNQDFVSSSSSSPQHQHHHQHHHHEHNNVQIAHVAGDDHKLIEEDLEKSGAPRVEDDF